MSVARDYTVTTWADGFGRYHAEIRCTGPGWGNTADAPSAAAHRERARRAIRRRLEDPKAVLRLEVAANEIDHMNRLRSITFREVL